MKYIKFYMRELERCKRTIRRKYDTITKYHNEIENLKMKIASIEFKIREEKEYELIKIRVGGGGRYSKHKFKIWGKKREV